MKSEREILNFESNSEKETESIASKFSKNVRESDIICFFGDVGAGKTVFTRGLCRGLGFKGYVNSPSYIVMNIYKTEMFSIYHFDLYRIGSTEELIEIGFYEFAGQEKSITIVEWAEMLDGELPEKRIDVRITSTDESRRKIIIERIG
ncbi:MAG TPA: tRNA (adenosine(37)-N6)-threonylcarbamoyltransferase complex ATPase subunit type 1 TsaE [Clostridiales bacterium]|nr:tRNA (adenosine(37)-N6)-threonylcarbamoyltransferase complex ATPase subunit type 1 TsaE [Clostridiales bacterium]HQP68776.1 tRNA (adenosine(37)-N6)-threonylcarbamoyltransferase complex ATPase subunit type 1 TsaE [Clostridiales bacterium]